jgi:hypothetical protein
MSKAKIAIVGCGGGSTTGSSNGHSDSSANWYQNGCHFARESIAKGEPSDKCCCLR